MLIAAELANEIHGMSISRRDYEDISGQKMYTDKTTMCLNRNTNPGVQEDGKRKIHRTKWEKLCEPNGSGGLGFRDLIKFNAALLAKQGWRLTNNDMSLFYRVFKSKYFPDCSWLEENPKQCGSYAWQKYHE
uniref:Uncharacterized protein n=1 Tax=Fagus sylvatica TaxID=28930 RepID=A0A2N9EJD4_FAGSY